MNFKKQAIGDLRIHAGLLKGESSRKRAEADALKVEANICLSHASQLLDMADKWAQQVDAEICECKRDLGVNLPASTPSWPASPFLLNPIDTTIVNIDSSLVEQKSKAWDKLDLKVPEGAKIAFGATAFHADELIRKADYEAIAQHGNPPLRTPKMGFDPSLNAAQERDQKHDSKLSESM